MPVSHYSGFPEDPPSLCSNSRGIFRVSAGYLQGILYSVTPALTETQSTNQGRVETSPFQRTLSLLWGFLNPIGYFPVASAPSLHVRTFLQRRAYADAVNTVHTILAHALYRYNLSKPYQILIQIMSATTPLRNNSILRYLVRTVGALLRAKLRKNNTFLAQKVLHIVCSR